MSRLGRSLLRFGAAVGVVCGLAACLVAVPSSAASKPPINVLVIAPVATAAQNRPEYYAGFAAAALSINKAGGIHGQKLEDTLCNDQFSPSVGAACASQAVSGHYTAVANIGTQGATEMPILDGAGIPMIGSDPSTVIETTDPLSFPLGTSSFDSYPALALALHLEHLKKLAIIAVETTPAETILASVKSAAQQFGTSVVATPLVPVTSADFAPAVEAMQAAGADSVVAVVTPTQITQLATTAKQLGFTAKIGEVAGQMTPAVLGQLGPLATNFVVVSPLPALTGQKLYPKLASFQHDMKAAQAAGVPYATTITYNALQGWLAAYSLVAAAPNIKGVITTSSLVAGLRKSKNLLIQGMMPWNPGGVGPTSEPRVTGGTIWNMTVKAGNLYITNYKKPTFDIHKVLYGVK